ncbi:MAG: hypothetical protein OXI30_07815 [Chloroflexota bacterium]|nr:hypothetical protein [Chloroflexota bacterium]
MTRVSAALRDHLPFIAVATLLTLVMTFPTIVYVFLTDVFWLPTGDSHDVYMLMWDVWYGEQYLTGRADRYYTDLLFYPEGLSLRNHHSFIPHIILVNVFETLLPLSNAFSLGYLLIIWLSALSAYVYLRWLLQDKWLALFGSVVFGFSPHVLVHPNHPHIAFVAGIPLILYYFQRGVQEKRMRFAWFAGLLAGLTTIVSPYVFVCATLMLGLVTCGYAMTSWRDGWYWRFILVLAFAVALASIWRLYPLVQDSASFQSSMQWYRDTYGEKWAIVDVDLISNFVNHGHPIFGPLGQSLLQTPADAEISGASFLGYLPMVLIGIALFSKTTRRKTLPWLAICAVFLLLRLGPTLQINGTEIESIHPPGHYAHQIAPSLFDAFVATDMFMMGAILPLAIMSCLGILALREWKPALTQPALIVAFALVVAFEYFIPIEGNLIPQEQFDHIDWLESEADSDEIRLINVPMNWKNSKRYNLYQIMGGFPQVEGATNRPPKSAYDYIRANVILGSWNEHHVISCETVEPDEYWAALEDLAADGFSHVVFHRERRYGDKIADSFTNAQPSYHDEFLSIFRLSDLHESCNA